MIIAFAGFKGSGKSEAVATLEQLGFVDVKMAAPLKAMLRTMYQYCGLTHDEPEEKKLQICKAFEDALIKNPKASTVMLLKKVLDEHLF